LDQTSSSLSTGLAQCQDLGIPSEDCQALKKDTTLIQLGGTSAVSAVEGEREEVAHPDEASAFVQWHSNWIR